VTADQAAPPASTAIRHPPATEPNLRVVWLLVVATFVVFLNETTMGVALRPIMLDLGIDARTGQWLTTAFMLTIPCSPPWHRVSGHCWSGGSCRPAAQRSCCRCS
jgi:hypothetical protein